MNIDKYLIRVCVFRQAQDSQIEPISVQDELRAILRTFLTDASSTLTVMPAVDGGFNTVEYNFKICFPVQKSYRLGDCEAFVTSFRNFPELQSVRVEACWHYISEAFDRNVRIGGDIVVGSAMYYKGEDRTEETVLP
jgi:hypothetical protein